MQILNWKVKGRCSRRWFLTIKENTASWELPLWSLQQCSRFYHSPSVLAMVLAVKYHWYCCHSKDLSCSLWWQDENLLKTFGPDDTSLCKACAWAFALRENKFPSQEYIIFPSVYLKVPSRERKINTDLLHKLKLLDLVAFSPRSGSFLLHLLPQQAPCLFNAFFLSLSDLVVLGWPQEYRVFKLSYLHYKIISCNQSLSLPKHTQDYLSQQNKWCKPDRHRGKYTELSQGRCEASCCQSEW